MEQSRMVFMASDVLLAEQESTRPYLSVTMRMCSTRPNRNREGVTEAFIDEIVANQEKYLCTPLYADIEALKGHHYNRLGHRYDPMTGTFRTTQIGSFNSFAKVADEYGVSLYGEARIPKREAAVCAALREMYEAGTLCFSFEISFVPEGCIAESGVMYIDAHPDNMLRGMAVVSVPAYPEATALALVAEQREDPADPGTGAPATAEGTPDEEDKDVKPMDDEENKLTGSETAAGGGTADSAPNRDDGTTASAHEVIQVDTLNSEVETHVTEEEVASAEAGTGAAEDAESTGASGAAEEKISVSDYDAIPPMSLPQPETTTGTVETVEEHTLRVTIHRLETTVAELTEKLAGYDAMKAELDTYRREAAEREHKEKVAKAETYATRMGLDLATAEVREAVDALDYEKLADLVMASIPEKESANPTGTMVAGVNYEEMKINPPDDGTYGGLIRNL